MALIEISYYQPKHGAGGKLLCNIWINTDNIESITTMAKEGKAEYLLKFVSEEEMFIDDFDFQRLKNIMR